MSTLRQRIYKVLKDDAKIGTVGHLGNLLGHTTTDPYGVYFVHPPEKPIFPLITYQDLSSAGRMPRVEAFNFTVWSGSVNAVLELIYGLLHEKHLGDAIDVQPVQMLWNWSGPTIFDENYEVYVRTSRFLVKGVHV